MHNRLRSAVRQEIWDAANPQIVDLGSKEAQSYAPWIEKAKRFYKGKDVILSKGGLVFMPDKPDQHPKGVNR